MVAGVEGAGLVGDRGAGLMGGGGGETGPTIQ